MRGVGVSFRKLLLVGPYPPPHGGVSVHVRGLREIMERQGIQCRVLNTDPRARRSPDYIKIYGALDFIRELGRHSWNGWAIHVHTNGHNRKSWLVALVSALAAKGGKGCVLTLHSGILPAYIKSGRLPRWMLALLTCGLYDRIICVNQEIRDTLTKLGVSGGKLEVKEAYLEASAPGVQPPADLQAWMHSHSPLLTTTMVMRPEYGYELLRNAMKALRKQYPRIGCVVMGVAGRPKDDFFRHAGDLPHDVCLSVMSMSDAFVRPTLQDGDSISVREAHSLGIPVVASNVGTRPDGTRLFEAGDVVGLTNTLAGVFPSSGR